MYSIKTLCTENPVFEIVRDESVKVYLHMYSGNGQQNPLCVESCVTKEFSISPQFSPTVFDPDANSVLLRAHLLYRSRLYAQKSLCSNLLRERECLYNVNVQQNHLCSASCYKGYSYLSPVLAYDFLSRWKFSTPTSTRRLYAQNPVFEIVRQESVKVYVHKYNGNVQQNPLFNVHL